MRQLTIMISVFLGIACFACGDLRADEVNPNDVFRGALKEYTKDKPGNLQYFEVFRGSYYTFTEDFKNHFLYQKLNVVSSYQDPDTKEFLSESKSDLYINDRLVDSGFMKIYLDENKKKHFSTRWLVAFRDPSNVSSEWLESLPHMQVFSNYNYETKKTLTEHALFEYYAINVDQFADDKDPEVTFEFVANGKILKSFSSKNTDLMEDLKKKGCVGSPFVNLKQTASLSSDKKTIEVCRELGCQTSETEVIDGYPQFKKVKTFEYCGTVEAIELK